jgi:hypothetical protein
LKQKWVKVRGDRARADPLRQIEEEWAAARSRPSEASDA